jgi:parallel beta-helix repeat protein
MHKSKNSGFVLILLCSLTCSVLIQSSNSQAKETLTISQDGSIKPSSAIVQRVGNTYYLTQNTSQQLIIERDNIVFDGNGYTFSGNANATAINLLCKNIILKNTGFTNWKTAIQSTYGYNTITHNYISTNYQGIATSSDSIIGNYITNNQEGIHVNGSYNLIYQNQVLNNTYGLAYSSNLTGNLVLENNFQNNQAAISTYTILLQVNHNNFINNSFPVQITQTQNSVRYNSNLYWDNGTEGNYWSNQPNNTQVIVHANSPVIIDRYPLNAPVDVSDVTLSVQSFWLNPTDTPSFTPTASIPEQNKEVTTNQIIDLTTIELTLSVVLLALMITAFFATKKNRIFKDT